MIALDFQLAHRFVHRADLAQVGSACTSGIPDDDFIAAVAVFAMTSAPHARLAVASISAWTRDTAFSRISMFPGEFPDPDRVIDQGEPRSA